MSETDDRTENLIRRGRLALALVAARAKQCPLKKCGRKGGSCHARFGRAGDNFHQPASPCPIMSEPEWRAVSLGMQFTGIRLKPWLKAREAARAAAEPRISSEERKRRWWLPEAVEKRAAAERRRLAHPGFPLGELLWQEATLDGLAVPDDIGAAGRRLVAVMSEHGCRCAAELCISPACEDGCAAGTDAVTPGVSGEARAAETSPASPP